MMKRYLSLLLVVSSISGCKSMTGDGLDDDNVEIFLKLQREFMPLTHIRQRPDMVTKLGAAQIVTVGNNAYVSDLEEWLSQNPRGSVPYQTTLRHEQMHAIRQEPDVFLWLVRYSYNPEFMYHEEQLAYYAEIHELRRLDEEVDVDRMAYIMSTQRNLGGRMVSEEEAKTWIQDVLAGRWKP